MCGNVFESVDGVEIRIPGKLERRLDGERDMPRNCSLVGTPEQLEQ